MNRYSPLDVAGPSPLDMIRAVPGIRRNPLAFLEQCVARHGELVTFPMPRTPVLLVDHPDGARRVLADNHAGYSKQTVQYGALSLVTGTGLLTADGPQWRQRRRIAQPAFRHTALPGVVGAAQQAAERLRAGWDHAPGQVLDAEAAVLRAMLDVVGATLFDDDLAATGDRLVAAVDVALRAVIARSSSPLPERLDWRTARRLRHSTAVLDAASADIVARRRARGLEGGEDVLALLLRAADAGEIDHRAVRDELVTLVIAGHETVAAALTWALHLLAAHPPVQERLGAELDAVLGAGPRARPPGWDDLSALPFTRAVLDEALRLYPPAWVISRRAVADDVLLGVDVPAGTLILLSPWLLHRREATWPDPQRFDPARFLDADGRTPRSRPSGEYLPFGVGPRLCIGRDVALVEGVLVLAGLLRGRRVVAVRTGEPRVEALVTLRPHGGLPLRLAGR